MFRWQIHKSEDTPDSICKLKEAFDHADAIIIGAGAGLSTSAGLSYSGERFHKYFHDFAEKYPIQDIYSGGFYPFDTLEEYWACRRPGNEGQVLWGHAYLAALPPCAEAGI